MKPFAGHSALTLEEAASRHEARVAEIPGPIPVDAMDPRDTTQPMDLDRDARRRDREAAERELAELQQTWAQRSPGAPGKEPDEDPTVIVDRERVRKWLEDEEGRQRR